MSDDAVICAMGETLPPRPAFSVVIPVFNSGDELTQALGSLERQAISDYEVIIVDDGSSEETRALCDKVAITDARITVLHQENMGQYCARRRGYLYARGRYILSLDADDEFDDSTFTTVQDAFRRMRVDVVLFEGHRNDANKTQIRRLPFSSESIFEEEGKTELYRIICSETSLNNVVLTAFVNDSRLLEGSFHDGRIRRGEDLVQCAELISNADRVGYIPDSLYVYKYNDKSITHTYYENGIRDLKVTTTYLAALSEAWGLDNAASLLSNKMLRGYAFEAREIVKHNRMGQAEDKLRELLVSFENDDCSRGKTYGLRSVDRYTLWLLKRGYFKLLFCSVRLACLLKEQ